MGPEVGPMGLSSRFFDMGSDGYSLRVAFLVGGSEGPSVGWDLWSLRVLCFPQLRRKPFIQEETWGGWGLDLRIGRGLFMGSNGSSIKRDRWSLRLQGSPEEFACCNPS